MKGVTLLNFNAEYFNENPNEFVNVIIKQMNKSQSPSSNVFGELNRKTEQFFLEKSKELILQKDNISPYHRLKFLILTEEKINYEKISELLEKWKASIVCNDSPQQARQIKKIYNNLVKKLQVEPIFFEKQITIDDGKKFVVNKFLWSAYSQILRKSLLGSWENNPSKFAISKEAFQVLQDYLEKKQDFPPYSLAVLMEIYLFAKTYEIKNAEKVCGKKLQDYIEKIEFPSDSLLDDPHFSIFLQNCPSYKKMFLNKFDDWLTRSSWWGGEDPNLKAYNKLCENDLLDEKDKTVKIEFNGSEFEFNKYLWAVKIPNIAKVVICNPSRDFSQIFSKYFDLENLKIFKDYIENDLPLEKLPIANLISMYFASEELSIFDLEKLCFSILQNCINSKKQMEDHDLLILEFVLRYYAPSSIKDRFKSLRILILEKMKPLGIYLTETTLILENFDESLIKITKIVQKHIDRIEIYYEIFDIFVKSNQKFNFSMAHVIYKSTYLYDPPKDYILKQLTKIFPAAKNYIGFIPEEQFPSHRNLY